MPVRPQIIGFSLAILVLAALLCQYRQFLSGPAPVKASTAAGPVAQAGSAVDKVCPPVSAPVLHVRWNQVLATVNGHPLMLRDIVPVTSTNPPETDLSAQDLKFFLGRAVDRELIFETAKKQGVFLDDSQQQQLAQFRSMRGQTEPGLITRLNPSQPDDDLELLDAEAFMLQTSLLARNGISPDVTAEEVSAYYQQHSAEYAGMTQDQAEYQIRTLLAPTERTKYQNELASYMNQIRANASISQMTM